MNDQVAQCRNKIEAMSREELRDIVIRIHETMYGDDGTPEWDSDTTTFISQVFLDHGLVPLEGGA